MYLKLTLVLEYGKREIRAVRELMIIFLTFLCPNKQIRHWVIFSKLRSHYPIPENKHFKCITINTTLNLLNIMASSVPYLCFCICIFQFYTHREWGSKWVSSTTKRLRIPRRHASASLQLSRKPSLIAGPSTDSSPVLTWKMMTIIQQAILKK